MKTLGFVALLTLLSLQAEANFPLYSQPHDLTNTLHQSSGNGMDYDQFAWDDFTLDTTATLLEIRWRGGYDPIIASAGYSRPVIDFAVSIWGTIAGQPDFTIPPLIVYDYDTGILNAGETFVGDFGNGSFGPTPMYDYHLVLPAPFTAQAGVRYWVKIEAFQAGVPNWGLAQGTGGNGVGFASFVNYAGGTAYRFTTFDAAFTLLIKDPVCGDWGFYPTDLNQDCRVDLSDYAILAGQWLVANCGTPLWCNGADLDKNNSVDLADLLQVAANWVACTEPYTAGCVKLN
jgi:hypothetical protein